MTSDTGTQDVVCRKTPFATDSPLISILIPAYADLDGVIRVLDIIPVSLVERGELEVLLSDDTSNFVIGNRVLSDDKYQFVEVFPGPGKGGAARRNKETISNNFCSKKLIEIQQHLKCVSIMLQLKVLLLFG